VTSLLLAGNDLVIDDVSHAEAELLIEKTKDVKRLVFSVDLEDGSHLALSDTVSSLLEAVLQVAAQGGRVTFTTLPQELTSAAAASWLGISRPTLMKLVHENKIPAHKTGTHTRLKMRDLIAFKEERNAKQKAAFAALRRLPNSQG